MGAWVLSCLPRLQCNHQPEEDHHDGSWYREPSCNFYQWLWAGGNISIYVSWFHRVSQSLTESWDQDTLACHPQHQPHAALTKSLGEHQVDSPHWDGSLNDLSDGRMPKDLTYEELVSGTRPQGHPQLHCTDVSKHNLKLLDMNIRCDETPSDQDQYRWKQKLAGGLHSGDIKQGLATEHRCTQRKNSPPARAGDTSWLNAITAAETPTR